MYIACEDSIFTGSSGSFTTPVGLHSTVHSSRLSAFSIRSVLIFYLFLHKNICCGYSLEAPHRGAFNEYPQYMFSWRNKKKYYVDTPLVWSYDVSSVSDCRSRGIYSWGSVLKILQNEGEWMMGDNSALWKCSYLPSDKKSTLQFSERGQAPKRSLTADQGDASSSPSSVL